ncbi:MAG: hypothetical protein KDJ73_05490 [Notoacmeibacter sp.]|nr:hypothetical protein [Notoacmeibacter sp.]
MTDRMSHRILVPVLLMFCATPAASDERQLVEMPAMMQEHMLGNMRDHLRALEEILAALATGDSGEAGRIAEARLGLSSLDDHGAAHIAKFIPPEMAAIGTSMHQAASRFVTIAADADLTEGAEGTKAVYGALGAITAACNACHAGYRVR